MATTDARPGFRLPWSSDREGAADFDPVDDGAPGAVDGPAPEAVGDPAHAVAETPDDEPVQRADELAEEPADEPAEEPARPVQPADGATPVEPRKPNRFMEELTKAMRATAEHAREETLERFRADAKSAIEAIHGGSSADADDLRRAADDDINAIREASKAEIARIREDADRAVAERQAGLEQSIEEQAARIEARLERVQTRVAAFEDEMRAFFERILGEDDPARFAAVAENLPEPPALDDDAGDETAAIGTAATVGAAEASDAPEAHDASDAPEAVVDPWVDATFSEPTDTPEPDARLVALGLSDAAAAEAEAEAEAQAAAQAEASGDTLPHDEIVTTRAIVVGLVSVASIAGFKRALGQLPGVRSVGVSSGPSGEFVFAIIHEATLDLLRIIPGLHGFGARVTRATDGVIEIAARDPETAP